MLGRAIVISQQGIQTHDDTWGTEAALRTVALGHTFLSWVRLLDIADTLDGDDMLPVDGYKWSKAGIYTGMIDLLGGWIVLRDDDGASTTTSFATATIKETG